MAQTFSKGLRVLQALAHSSEPRGLSELARSLQMNQSAVQRLLNALVEAGYAEQPAGTHKYQLTTAVWELGMRSIAEAPTRRLLRPTLRLGMQATGMTCFFSLSATPFVIYFERVEGPRSRAHSADLGRKIPITATASGKSIVAYLPATMRAALSRDAVDWTGYVSYSGKPAEEIEAIVRDVRRARYASSQSGMRSGVNSVAAPVWGPGPLPLGAIAVTASEEILRPQDVPEIGAKVLELAEEATISLGGANFRNAAERTPYIG